MDSNQENLLNKLMIALDDKSEYSYDDFLSETNGKVDTTFDNITVSNPDWQKMFISVCTDNGVKIPKLLGNKFQININKQSINKTNGGWIEIIFDTGLKFDIPEHYGILVTPVVDFFDSKGPIIIEPYKILTGSMDYFLNIRVWVNENESLLTTKPSIKLIANGYIIPLLSDRFAKFG